MKQGCYRYTAPPCEYQTYADFAPDDDGKCEYYWPGNAQRGGTAGHLMEVFKSLGYAKCDSPNLEQGSGRNRSIGGEVKRRWKTVKRSLSL